MIRIAAIAFIAMVGTPCIGQSLTNKPVWLECVTGDADCLDVSLDEAMKSEQSAKQKACKPGECETTLERYPSCGVHKNHPFWTSVNAMRAEAEFQTMLRRSASGELFNALGKSGSKIIEIVQANAEEHHYALCRIETINGIPGRPKACETMAIVTPATKLIRSAWRQAMCLASAYVGKDGASIEISFKVQDARARGDQLLAAVVKLLRSDLGMQFEQDSQRGEDGGLSAAYFTAVAPIRESKILTGGIRESLDLSISIFREQDGYSLRGHAKPMICRTASGNVTEYHGLNDSQKSQYATLLNKNISQAISSACKSFVEIDDATLSCR